MGCVFNISIRYIDFGQIIGFDRIFQQFIVQIVHTSKPHKYNSFGRVLLTMRLPEEFDLPVYSLFPPIFLDLLLSHQYRRLFQLIWVHYIRHEWTWDSKSLLITASWIFSIVFDSILPLPYQPVRNGYAAAAIYTHFSKILFGHEARRLFWG